MQDGNERHGDVLEVTEHREAGPIGGQPQLPQVRDGRISLPPGPGLGVVPDADALEAAATGPWREIGS